MIVDEWKGCYPSAWRGLITPESFSHPAKGSSRLAERIYKHTIDEGWLHEHSTVIDPFGGIGGFAFHAVMNGMIWTGVELEPKFVKLCQDNIELWDKKFRGKMPHMGTARIIQGDSRHLAQVIGAAEACISSPPYAEGLGHGMTQTRQIDIDKGLLLLAQSNYGSTPGNLGNLPPGDVDACISSPPYAEAINTHGEGPNSIGERHAAPGPNEQAVKSVGMAYGQTPGQLASLPLGAFEAAISSPPFEESNAVQGGMQRGNGSKLNQPGDRFAFDNQNNLGNDNGDTFWSAAREIVAQVYAVLAPGAHAIWVVKSYVKNKTLVDFPHQWQALCEACGFVTLHEHHALLVRHGATSIDIDGNHHEKKTESKSFFRRLAEKNGSPRIDFETVLCMVKPGGAGGGWDGAISSPPFTEDQPCASQTQALKDYHAFTRGDGTKRDHTMTTPGNLGSLPPGSLDDVTRHGG